MREVINRVCLGLLLVCVSGCASTLNPFKDGPSCPYADKGQCMGVYDAYDQSKKIPDGPAPKKDTKKPDAAVKDTQAEAPKPTGTADLYQAALYNQMYGLIREPHAPLLVPEKLVRGLFMPVEGDEGELYMEEQVYIKMDGSHYLLLPPGSAHEDGG